MIYNKLVRDKIPENIAESGGKANIRTLPDEEYLRFLEAKLDEEVAEFHQDKSVEELADILEVVYALAATAGCSLEQLVDVFQKKHEARGGFEKRYFLVSTEDI